MAVPRAGGGGGDGSNGSAGDSVRRRAGRVAPTVWRAAAHTFPARRGSRFARETLGSRPSVARRHASLSFAAASHAADRLDDRRHNVMVIIV